MLSNEKIIELSDFYSCRRLVLAFLNLILTEVAVKRPKMILKYCNYQCIFVFKNKFSKISRI